jgi:hypothetical protein
MYQTRGYPLDLGLRRAHRRTRRPVRGRLLAWTLRRARRGTGGPPDCVTTDVEGPVAASHRS